jgi:hypothetical protein
VWLDVGGSYTADVNLRPATTALLLLPFVALLSAKDCVASTSFAAAIQAGTIQNSSIVEASGIVASRLNPNVLWTHNDSGDTARIFAMTPAGSNLGTYSISGASASDWEDMATGPGPVAGTQYLYIGDIGDNGASRSTVAVYRVPEPVVSDTQSPVTSSISGAVKFTFSYPNGAHDAESLFVDPLTKDIYIISKPGTTKYLYRAAYPQSTSGTTVLELAASFADTDALTAADISPNGTEIIMRSYATSSGRLYVRPPGGSVAAAFSSPYVSIPVHSETQGEAIGFDPRGWGYYTTSEGSNRPIYYFDRLPHGDFNHNGIVDGADYVAWRKNLGTTYTSTDYATWRGALGNTAGTGAVAEFSAVPEPKRGLLLIAAVAIQLASRRRFHSL